MGSILEEIIRRRRMRAQARKIPPTAVLAGLGLAMLALLKAPKDR